MSNYSHINSPGQADWPFRVPDMVAWFSSGTAMVGRSSVSQVVGSSATARALFKSHALPRNISVAVICGSSRGGA